MIEERFNDEGVAVVFAGGVKVGSHVVTVEMVEGEIAWSFFDILGLSNEEEEGDSQFVLLDLDSCEAKENHDEVISVMFVDTVVASRVDGQRRIWLEQVDRLADPSKFVFSYAMLGDWSSSSFFRSELSRRLCKPLFLSGHKVRSDADADFIAELFRSAKGFDELSDIVRAAFGELCAAFSEHDVVVLFNHPPSSEDMIHDHYLVELAKLCGGAVVFELPLPPTDVVSRLEPSVFVAPSLYALQGLASSKADTVIIHPGGGNAVDAHGDELRIVAANRLDPDKSPLLLLRAVSILKARFGDSIELQVAGSGILENDLKRAAAELGVSDCVTWLGHVADVPRMLRGAVFVNPSDFPQTWAITNLEAMSSGAVVIGFVRGGPGEYMENGVNCVVPKEHSPEGIAEALGAVLHDAELRGGLREEGKRTVEEGELTMGNMASKYARLYRYLVS